MELKRVVVTGVGALTPIGNNAKEFWDGLLQGKSGAAPITRFDASLFKTQFACEVKNLNVEDHLDRKELRRMDRCTHLGLIAADEAILDSGIESSKTSKDRIGVIWGSGIGGIDTFFEEAKNFVEGGGSPRFSPFFIPKMIADICGGYVSMKYGYRGPNYTTVSACASSTNAIIDALMLLRLGKADVIVCGGSEAAIGPGGIGGFNAMHALSTRNDDPTSASRPFDKDRDGFVMGEGSACMVLESYDHAIARGARIYAELAGGGLSADAHHLTAPHPDGLGALNVMRNCLEDAGMMPEDVDYVNVHGTSTPLGDIAETKAIQGVFGDHAYNLNISSTKSMTGHLLGAAGAAEALVACLSVVHDIIPPTINHFTDDPELDNKLNFTFNVPQKRIVRAALSNTFGFGGHNASVVFKKVD
ncbi:MAG TPA: beta-ketoacyl-[acyl-carrier-protein] synthase II [Cryomorphaceae bacterium]|jgi:3-oxoacyl-[acyl-carrier-protein] synthase II|nr:beta-ketoacyl-ACP synthase II [Cryomorphaceae bacterium]HAB31096.1 beta-ketoacyl-[acyl-carrier-protein] synthase II [Cryomorphaceae bacterium]HAG48631.1 beta-ketoacyl-[acyl-carrier-protein] synthase II [Cryomorphaceae bacterium]|tara:strand:+ start:249 stop:1499 length:1251 start_codon:yes stop_codon:yes gene_type:complete